MDVGRLIRRGFVFLARQRSVVSSIGKIGLEEHVWTVTGLGCCGQVAWHSFEFRTLGEIINNCRGGYAVEVDYYESGTFFKQLG